MKALFFFVVITVLTGFSAAAQKAASDGAKMASITEMSVEVEGGKILKLKAADLAKLPRKDIKATDHDGVEATYSGVELREIISLAGAKLGKELRGPAIAQFLVIEAIDGYHAVYSVTELDPDFTDKTVLLADKRDGKDLDSKNGPWQIIATNEKKHARWVRQVTALKVKIAK